MSGRNTAESGPLGGTSFDGGGRKGVDSDIGGPGSGSRGGGESRPTVADFRQRTLKTNTYSTKPTEKERRDSSRFAAALGVRKGLLKRDKSFGEHIAEWLGFKTTDFRYNPVDEEYDRTTSFDFTDSGLIGGLLTIANPLLGAAYGVTTNLAHNRPASALASALSFGPALPIGALGTVGIKGGKLAGYDVDAAVNGVLDDSVERGNFEDVGAVTGVNVNTGRRASPPDKDGGYEPPLIAKGTTEQPSPKLAASPTKVSDRYVQSRKLGPANIRRKEYAGLPLMGLLESLGYS